MNLLIAGASGLIGNFLLELLLDDPNVSKVISLVRSKTSNESEKLIELIVNFEELEHLELPFAPDQFFCALGTTMAKAGSRQSFRKVDFVYPHELAKLALKSQADTFHIVTAMGAKLNSNIFYNHVKGEIEEALINLNFNHLYIYRPSLLLGSRTEQRRGEKLAQALSPLFNLFLIGPLKKYRGIKGLHVAKAMHRIAQNKPADKSIFLSDEIARLAI